MVFSVTGDHSKGLCGQWASLVGQLGMEVQDLGRGVSQVGTSYGYSNGVSGSGMACSAGSHVGASLGLLLWRN